MPTYEYRCTAGHTFEVFQSMADDPVTKCDVCGKPVERVFHAPAVHFKGSGFYTTDYARKGATGGSDSKDSSSKESKSNESKPAGNGGDSKSSSSESKAKASDSD